MPPGSGTSRAPIVEAADPGPATAPVGAGRWARLFRLRSVTGQLGALITGELAVVAVSATVLIVTLVQSDHASASARMLSRARADAGLAVAQMLFQQNALLGYVVTGNATDRAAFDSAGATFTSDLQQVRDELVATGVPTTQVDTLTATHQRWRAESAAPLLALVDGGRIEQARSLVDTPAAAAAAQTLRTVARAAWDGVDAQYSVHLAEARGLRDRVTGLVIGLLAVILATLLAAWLIVRRTVVRPLLRLQAATRRVAAGAWDDTVGVRGPAEVTALAADVDSMRAELVQAVANEQRAAEALDQQGPAVVALRQALQPAPWQQRGFESTGRLDPVEGLLAGDWYDVVALDDDRVGVVLGDVAGHGAGSGVYALRLKGLLRSSLLARMSPAAALAELAAHIARFPDDPKVASGELFATVFVAVADRSTGELAYASAGHLDAVVMRAVPAADGGAPRHFDHLDLPPTGPMLSTLLADRIWTERRHRFVEQDLLVAATDGVIEARDAAGRDEFGIERIVGRLGTRLAAGGTLAEAVDAVFVDIADFERRARDDRTLVALRQASVLRRFDATRIGSARPVRPT